MELCSDAQEGKRWGQKLKACQWGQEVILSGLCQIQNSTELSWETTNAVKRKWILIYLNLCYNPESTIQ